jgi:hypothetical protein
MFLSRIAGVVALPLLGACAILESSSGPGPGVVVTSTTAPLDLALGDTARITVTVRNNGDFAVEVHAQRCNNDFYISGPDGDAYTPAEQVYCTLELKAPIYLSQGESIDIQAFTTGRVVPQGSQDAPTMLSPGTYRMRPVVRVSRGDETAVLVSATPTIVTFR